MENLEKPDSAEKKEKPEVLYHSSSRKGIEEFRPNKGNFRDEDEGVVIFSTPNKALASAFLIEGHNDSWTKIGFYGGIPAVIIDSDREEFIKKDKGGVMYELPSDTFDYDPEKGMGEKEWTSREPVKPLSETEHPSALDAMIENGVQVYFVDKKTFDEIAAADDHGRQLLASLRSENMRRGMNARPITC